MICSDAVFGDTPGKALVRSWLIGLALLGGAARPAQACTSFAMEHNGGLLFGSNYDNDFRPGMLFVNKRGVAKNGFLTEEGETAPTWTSRYGSVTINTAPYQYAWAGMNEAGLVISTMQLDDTQVPPPDGRPSLISAAWVQYVLDTCATLDDVVEAERRMRVNYGVDHYLVCDATGQCMTIEFLQGKPVYHRGEDLPLPALSAGWPYARCFVDRGGGKTVSRIAGPLPRIDAMFRAYQPEGSESGVDYAFRILKGVSADNTTWSLVFDVKNRVFHFRTYKNARVRHLALKDLDFSCRTPVMMLDMHARYSGDVSTKLKAYSHEVVLKHTLESIAFHRPDMPEETVRQMLEQMEQFACTEEK